MRKISADDLCKILEDHEKGLYADASEVSTDLSGVDLRATYNLRFAKLSIAILDDADLRGADLRGADLSVARLSGAKLSGAKLSKANLSEANLSKADLREVSGLNIEQLSQTETLYNAKLDPELMAQVKDKYPHLLKKPKEEESKPDE